MEGPSWQKPREGRREGGRGAFSFPRPSLLLHPTHLPLTRSTAFYAQTLIHSCWR